MTEDSGAATFTMTSQGNETLHGDGFFVSFRDRSAHPSSEIAQTFDLLGTLVGIEARATCETALFTDDDKVWRILDGDFRAEYEAAYPSLVETIAVYDRNRDEHRSDWSSDE